MKILFQQFDRNRKEIMDDFSDVCMIPEVSDGFDASLASDVPGMMPVSLCSEKVSFGIYAVHVVLEALEDVEELYLFTGRKQLREIVTLKKGQCLSRVYYLSAAEIIPRYYDSVYPVTRLFVTFCTEKPECIRVHECTAQPAEDTVRIFLCGDSTVTDHSCEIPYHPGACYAGWGQDLLAFLTGEVTVENQAHCGLTTESFRTEGHFELVRKHIHKNDFCLLQFAHNDQKLAHLMADRGYTDNLHAFLDEVRECGGRPVLVTPPGRNIWNADGTYLELLDAYANAVKKLAEKTGTPWINLHEYSVKLIKKMGMKRSRDYFHPEDYTHTNEYGAYRLAEFLAKELEKLFPDRIHCKKEEKPFLFEPPADLWDSMNKTASRVAASDQKEQFDRMEKSTSDLLEVIRAAKEEAFGQ